MLSYFLDLTLTKCMIKIFELFLFLLPLSLLFFEFSLLKFFHSSRPGREVLTYAHKGFNIKTSCSCLSKSKIHEAFCFLKRHAGENSSRKFGFFRRAYRKIVGITRVIEACVEIPH